MSNELDLDKVPEGFQTPGAFCKNCKAPLAVVNDPASIPDTFHVACPSCTHDDTYRKADITSVEIRRTLPHEQMRPI